MTKYNFSDNVRNDEFTSNFENFVLSRLVAGEDRELLYLTTKVVTVDDEQVVVVEPQVRNGSKLFPMQAMWSRNTLTPVDVDKLSSFNAVDAIVRYGTFTDESGMEHVSSSPKIVALIDDNKRIFVPTGAKREYKGE